MRVVTADERRARLARRHFLAGDAAVPITAIAGALVGLHATDPATPYLSLWARSAGFTRSDLDRELYERRSLVRHLAMRRTLWLFPAENLTVIQSGASDRVADNERRRLAADALKAGLGGDGWVDRACAAVLDHLERHGSASSTELRKALPELAGTHDYAPGKRWGGETPLAPRVLTVLSVRGDIVRGAREGSSAGAWTVSRPRWTRLEDWLGARPEPMPAEKARTELVRAWLNTFGPAGVEDVKWWFGSTLTAARHALRDVDAVQVDMDGETGYLLPDDVDVEPESGPWAALLPGLDPTTMGWSRRDWYLGAHRPKVFDTSGNAGPTAWWNGQIVGGWRQDADARVQLQLLDDPGRDGRRALQRRADELTGWLDGVRVNPRFPSPLSKLG